MLVATTIIENGLDIPNANTMIINRADRYGLAQLYQLRGRVGRSDRRAYAYLLVPPGNALSGVARKRLAAIREFSDLGSGFRVAALDLEIRGSGNLLGGEQSGHIEAIGFEMYLQLLEETIRELKGEELVDDVAGGGEPEGRPAHRRGVHPRHEPAPGCLPADRGGPEPADELEDTMAEVRDRYGPPPGFGAQPRQLRQHPAAGGPAARRMPSTGKGSTVVFRFRPGAASRSRTRGQPHRQAAGHRCFAAVALSSSTCRQVAVAPSA